MRKKNKKKTEKKKANCHVDSIRIPHCFPIDIIIRGIIQGKKKKPHPPINDTSMFNICLLYPIYLIQQHLQSHFPFLMHVGVQKSRGTDDTRYIVPATWLLSALPLSAETMSPEATTLDDLRRSFGLEAPLGFSLILASLTLTSTARMHAKIAKTVRIEEGLRKKKKRPRIWRIFLATNTYIYILNIYFDTAVDSSAKKQTITAGEQIEFLYILAAAWLWLWLWFLSFSLSLSRELKFAALFFFFFFYFFFFFFFLSG
jgi:hypothetical protein